MTKAERGKIAPIQLFYIIFICRVVVSLTYVQSVTTGTMETDILISIAFALLATLLMSFPIMLCVKKNKNPLDIKGVNILYIMYYIGLIAMNISRFSYFASARLNTGSRAWYFSLLILLAATYAAYLGIEGIGRFSSLSFVILIISVVVLLGSNLSNLEIVNFYPIISNEPKDIAFNMLLLSSNTAESVLFLALSKRVNGKKIKPFVIGIVFAYIAIFLLIFFVIGVLGASASLQSYPVYSLSQLAKVGLFDRLDVIYNAFWIFAIFIKAAVLIYSISISTKKYSHASKCMLSGFVGLALTVLATELLGKTSYPHALTIIPFVIFTVVIPLLTLLFKKENKGEALLEKF